MTSFWTNVGLFSAAVFLGLISFIGIGRWLQPILRELPRKIRRNPLGAIVPLILAGVMFAYGSTKPTPPDPPDPPPAPTVVVVPKAETNLVYNGKVQTGVPSGENYTITGNTAVEVGEYVAVAKLVKGNYIWDDGTTNAQEIAWSIAAAPQPPDPPPPPPPVVTGIVCAVDEEYETKQPIGDILVLVTGGELQSLKASGLPAGLKLTTKNIMKKGSKTEVEHVANSIYGTPTKSGLFTTTLTATLKDRTTLTKSVRFTVVARLKDEVIVDAMWDASQGKVTGAGVYAPGKRVTLKATASKGYVFNGWYSDEDLVSQAASYAFSAPAEDVAYEACFVTAEEDKASIRAAVNGMVLSSLSLETNVMCAVALRWPVAASALSLPTVKISGLPTGLKFTAKEMVISGAPTKTGLSKVKVTVTTAGKSKAEYVIALTVVPLPDWVVGTFDGGGDDGQVTLTVAKTGKISGKYLADGKSYSFSAPSFSSYDEATGTYTAEIVMKVGTKSETLTLTLVENENFGGFVTCTTEKGDTLFVAYQNFWKTAAWKDVGKTIANKALTLENGVTLKFAANGTVKATYKEGNKTYSGSAVLVTVGEPSVYGFTGVVWVYIPPKGTFKGLCEAAVVRWNGAAFAEGGGIE